MKKLRKRNPKDTNQQSEYRTPSKLSQALLILAQEKPRFINYAQKSHPYFVSISFKPPRSDYFLWNEEIHGGILLCSNLNPSLGVSPESFKGLSFFWDVGCWRSHRLCPCRCSFFAFSLQSLWIWRAEASSFRPSPPLLMLGLISDWFMLVHCLGVNHFSLNLPVLVNLFRVCRIKCRVSFLSFLVDTWLLSILVKESSIQSCAYFEEGFDQRLISVTILTALTFKTESISLFCSCILWFLACLISISDIVWIFSNQTVLYSLDIKMSFLYVMNLGLPHSLDKVVISCYAFDFKDMLFRFDEVDDFYLVDVRLLFFWHVVATPINLDEFCDLQLCLVCWFRLCRHSLSILKIFLGKHKCGSRFIVPLLVSVLSYSRHNGHVPKSSLIMAVGDYVLSMLGPFASQWQKQAFLVLGLLIKISLSLSFPFQEGEHMSPWSPWSFFSRVCLFFSVNFTNVKTLLFLVSVNLPSRLVSLFVDIGVLSILEQESFPRSLAYIKETLDLGLSQEKTFAVNFLSDQIIFFYCSTIYLRWIFLAQGLLNNTCCCFACRQGMFVKNNICLLFEDVDCYLFVTQMHYSSLILVNIIVCHEPLQITVLSSSCLDNFMSYEWVCVISQVFVSIEPLYYDCSWIFLSWVFLPTGIILSHFFDRNVISCFVLSFQEVFFIVQIDDAFLVRLYVKNAICRATVYVYFDCLLLFCNFFFPLSLSRVAWTISRGSLSTCTLFTLDLGLLRRQYGIAASSLIDLQLVIFTLSREVFLYCLPCCLFGGSFELELVKVSAWLSVWWLCGLALVTSFPLTCLVLAISRFSASCFKFGFESAAAFAVYCQSTLNLQPLDYVKLEWVSVAPFYESSNLFKPCTLLFDLFSFP